MVLRRATPRDRYAKAASVGTFNPQFDIDYVWHKFPYARQLGDWLINRLGKANCRRREFFKYCKEHRQKLGTPASSKGGERKHLNKSRGPREGLSVARFNSLAKTLVSSEPSTSNPTPTTASDYIEDFTEPMQVEESDERSVTSYATSIMVQEHDGLAFPPRPKESASGRPFECPFCYEIQEIKSERAWRYLVRLCLCSCSSSRNHVMRDLHPYICTFKGCSFKLFSSRHEWFEHELLTHQKSWRCDRCFKFFKSVPDFTKHIQRCYQSLRTMPNLIDNLILKCEQSVKSISPCECPLCDWNSALKELNPQQENLVVNVKQFEQHLGQHLEKLALFALPRLQNSDDSEDAVSGVATGHHLENELDAKSDMMDIEPGYLVPVEGDPISLNEPRDLQDRNGQTALYLATQFYSTCSTNNLKKCFIEFKRLLTLGLKEDGHDMACIPSYGNPRSLSSFHPRN